jgi:signal transduction histidine kinase
MVTAMAAALVVAAASGAAALALLLRLRRLRDEQRVREAELERAFGARQALERAQAEARERDRIYRDLHDDVGARLLDLVYMAPDEATATRAREALQQLRALVASSRRPPARLLELLEEVRAEAARRLAGRPVELLWQQAPDVPDVTLDGAQTLHLGRIVREAVTNALKHGRPTRLRVRADVAADHLLLDITDDGEFAGRGEGGTGTESMQERAAQLHGTIAWKEGTWGGTKVALRVPLVNGFTDRAIS